MLHCTSLSLCYNTGCKPSQSFNGMTIILAFLLWYLCEDFRPESAASDQGLHCLLIEVFSEILMKIQKKKNINDLYRPNGK